MSNTKPEQDGKTSDTRNLSGEEPKCCHSSKPAPEGISELKQEELDGLAGGQSPVQRQHEGQRIQYKK
jgi:hypothetical protein